MLLVREIMYCKPGKVKALVGEMEVESVAEFEKWMTASTADPTVRKEFEAAMQGYHDLVDSGRREIYKIEGRSTRALTGAWRRSSPRD